MRGINPNVTIRRFRKCALVLLAVVVAGFGAMVHAQSTQHDIVLMLDNSGSMRKNDPDFLTSVAVHAFIEGLGDDYHVAIISFDQRVKVLKPLAVLDTAHRAALLSSLSDNNYRGLLTNSPAALERSIYELRTNGRPDAQKSIVFMTDGIVDVAPEGADSGDVEKARWMKSTLAEEAGDSSVRIFGIAFTDTADFELIQTLARRTGGEYYRAYTAAEIDGVFSNIRDQLAGATPVAAPSPGVNRFIAPLPASPAPGAGENAKDVASTSVSEQSTAQVTAPDATALAVAEPTTTTPEISLPEGELPIVSLPVVSLGRDDSAPAADSTAPSSTTDSASATATDASADTGTDTGAGEATPVAAGDGLTQPAGDMKSTQAPAPGDGPAPLDDSKFYIALMVGAATILLALAALIFVLMRRRPTAAAPSDALMPTAFLNDISGCTEKQSYEVGSKPIVVGRIKGADSEAADFIVIDETTIGRRHALIEYKEHSFWVTDQNSLNGTFVNNTRIESGMRLKHGDRIRFHKHEFEFLVLDMFETDRTMMSETMFTDLTASSDDDDNDEGATVVRADDENFEIHDPSAENQSITRG